MGLDPDCWRVRHVRFITVLPILNFTIQIQQKMAFSPDAVATVATFYAPATSLLALVAALTFPWYIWVVDWLDRQGLRRSRDILPCEALLAGDILSRETGALCAVSDTSLAFVYFSFMTILLTYLLSQLLASLFL